MSQQNDKKLKEFSIKKLALGMADLILPYDDPHATEIIEQFLTISFNAGKTSKQYYCGAEKKNDKNPHWTNTHQCLLDEGHTGEHLCMCGKVWNRRVK